MNPASILSKESAEESILRSANELFYERGIAGVAMADVRATNEVGSLKYLRQQIPTVSFGLAT
jgi:hypothetical protein